MGASGPPSLTRWDAWRRTGAPRPAPGLAVSVLREKSCGIVPFREVDGEIRYLVISSAVTKREHWEFPKGGVEEGEREIETALRELWEETGVKDVRVLPGYREPIRYIYRRPEGLVSKQVVYFIARVSNPAVTLREVEAKDYRWANYEETRKLLRHANARALLERCHAFILGRPLPAPRNQQLRQRQESPEAGDVSEAQRRRSRRRRGARPEAKAPLPAGSEAKAPAAAPPAPPRAAAPAPAASGAANTKAAAGRDAGQRRRRRRRRGGRRQERGDRQQAARGGAESAPDEPV